MVYVLISFLKCLSKMLHLFRNEAASLKKFACISYFYFKLQKNYYPHRKYSCFPRFVTKHHFKTLKQERQCGSGFPNLSVCRNVISHCKKIKNYCFGMAFSRKTVVANPVETCKVVGKVNWRRIQEHSHLLCLDFSFLRNVNKLIY
jgi:hypothetical protein